jgi:hypothetical protein
VKILLGELRQKTDELRRMRFELEATQRMLYDSQATMEDVQAAKWRELSTAAVGCVGLAAGLRTYFKTSLSKVIVSAVVCQVWLCLAVIWRGEASHQHPSAPAYPPIPLSHLLFVLVSCVPKTFDTLCSFWLQINVEKKRALVGVEVEVQERLGGVMAEVVKDQVAERLADAVEAVSCCCLFFQCCMFSCV